jgi:ABC-type nitrate/sulfonate/bicarbonate transport system permease component
MIINFFNPHSLISAMTRRSLGIIAFFSFIGLWTVLSASGLISPNKLPSPVAVVQAFSYLAWYNGQSMLLTATLASLARIGLAALLVIAIGIPIGVLMGASPKLNAFLSPLIDPFRSAPVVALLPLFVMWFGIDEQMKVAFLFMGAVVYMIPLVRDAMVSVPYAYWESTRDLGGTYWECVIKGVLPMAAPRIFDAIIISISVCWGYITVAEYVNAGDGLGQLIQNARRFSAIDQVIAGIFVIIALALATQVGLTALKSKLYPWEGTQQ